MGVAGQLLLFPEHSSPGQQRSPDRDGAHKAGLPRVGDEGVSHAKVRNPVTRTACGAATVTACANHDISGAPWCIDCVPTALRQRFESVLKPALTSRSLV